MNTKLIHLLAVASLALPVLSGCSQPPATPAAPTESPSVRATACGSCDGLPQADHTGISDPGWDEQAKTDAVNIASAAMVLYNRPTLDGKRWIYDLAQYMTNEAGALYQGVDPANLPVFKTLGAPTLVVDPSNGFASHAQFSTTIGVFDFELRRQGAGREWKIQYITLPDGFH